jgi:hypothetical protein
MFKRVLLIAAAVLGISGAALATGNHDKKDFKPCKLKVTDGPLIHNPHCKPSPIPVQTTPTPIPEATPEVTPEATPTVTPTPSVTTRAASSTKVNTPAVLPSVGGSGRQRP